VLASRDGRRYERRKPQVDADLHEPANPTSLPLGSWVRDFLKQPGDVAVEFFLRSASPVAVLASRNGRRHERRKPQVDAGLHERRKPHVVAAACLGGFGSWGTA
jgi:hypothetical protein